MNGSNLALRASLILSTAAAVLSAVALLVVTGVLGDGRPASRDFASEARAFLLENPEVLVEMFQLLEQREQRAAESELGALVRARAEEIFEDPATPVGANPEGDVSLVEFFDYNCPYCYKAAPLLAQLVGSDPELRLVYKEFPILGPGSRFAARAALASARQGRYEAFHQALMTHPGRISEDSTLELAQKVGLDVDRLTKDMEDPAIAAAIERNLALARDLRITGTPSWVVGEEVIFGLVDPSTLQRAIATARAGSSGE